MKGQAKFTHYSLGKALEKQTKTTKDQGRKQAETLKVLKPDVKQLSTIGCNSGRSNK